MDKLERRKNITDAAYSLGAVALLNAVIQLVLYPYINRKIGDDAFGVALSMLSFVSITANSLGMAGNLSRIVNERTIKPANGDYNIILAVGSLLAAIGGFVFLLIINNVTVGGVIFYSLLIIATTFRYYLDVEFRYKKNFLRFFIYYAMISGGYLVGILVFKLTGVWSSAIFTGELFAIIYCIFASELFKKTFVPSKNFGRIAASVGLLFISELCSNLSLNADRLLLLRLGGTAVTVYYAASLIGKVVAMLTGPTSALIMSRLVHYDGGLTKKLWSIFCLGAFGVVAAGFIGGLIGSKILLPFLYPNVVEAASEFLVPAILGQILFFVSGVLLVILLRFRGEKQQFAFNIAYVAEFFALTIVGTRLFGLKGFVWAALIANALRFAFVVVRGFFAKKDKEITEEEKNAD